MAVGFHRIGGASIENLRLKPREATLIPPGISVVEASSASEAASQFRIAFPRATKLHKRAELIGSATIDAIRMAGFDVYPAPSTALPNHSRIIHPDGVAGFNDENLARLMGAFVNTSGH